LFVERSTRQLVCFSGRVAERLALVLATLALLTPLEPFAMPSPLPAPAQLKATTATAFDRYVRSTEARNDAELRLGTKLLWVDGLSEAGRAEAYAELRRGEVKTRKLETRENGAAIRCPDGMIHHWASVVFIPRAKLLDVLVVLQDYDRHAEYYAPDVERSRLESRDGDHFRAFLRFRRHKVITVVLDTEHDVRYFRDSETGAHSRSSAVRIAQVENPGKSEEREKTPGDDDGFLWRMETWWRMLEDDGGVYVQSEVVSLTRDIPAGLAWLIGPFVTSIPKESLTFTLDATRTAVEACLKNRRPGEARQSPGYFLLWRQAADHLLAHHYLISFCAAGIFLFTAASLRPT
jgi:hypothetical protein